jgi:hypothetical protein
MSVRFTCTIVFTDPLFKICGIPPSRSTSSPVDPHKVSDQNFGRPNIWLHQPIVVCHRRTDLKGHVVQIRHGPIFWQHHLASDVLDVSVLLYVLLQQCRKSLWLWFAFLGWGQLGQEIVTFRCDYASTCFAKHMHPLLLSQLELVLAAFFGECRRFGWAHHVEVLGGCLPNLDQCIWKDQVTSVVQKVYSTNSSSQAGWTCLNSS